MLAAPPPQTITLTIPEPEYPEQWRYAPELYLPALVTHYTDAYDAIVIAGFGIEYHVECRGWPDDAALAAELEHNLQSVWYQTLEECNAK